MSKETIRKLSSLVKDKEMEVDALRQKNDSLLTVLQTTAGSSSGADGEFVKGRMGRM